MYKVILRGATLGAILLMATTISKAQSPVDSNKTEAQSPVGVKIETPQVSADTLIADEVVAIVGNNCILLSDVQKTALRIKEQRKQQGSLSKLTEKEEALEMLLTTNLMSTRARLDSLDKNMQPIDVMVEQQVADLVAQAGSITKLEQLQGKPIFQIKSDITQEVKEIKLAEEMENNIKSKVKVDKHDVVEYINGLSEQEKLMIPEQYSFSQIVKVPPQTDERKYAVRQRLLEFRKRILDKEISLGALAQLYSADLGSASRRGEMGPVDARVLDPAFMEAGMALEPGEVSEIVESEYGFHIIELIAKTPATLHVRHILLKPEFTLEEEKAVVAQLDSISNVISNGKLTFNEAALVYSDDKDTKQNGGKVFNKVAYQQTFNIRLASTFFAAQDMETMPMDYGQISRMKVGEISSPYQSIDDKGSLVQKIIRLDAILPAHKANIVDDYDLLEGFAKVQKERKDIESWIDDQVQKIYVEIKDEYLSSANFERDCWKEAALRTKNRENSNLVLPDYDELYKVAKERARRNAAQLAAIEKEMAEKEADLERELKEYEAEVAAEEAKNAQQEEK